MINKKQLILLFLASLAALAGTARGQGAPPASVRVSEARVAELAPTMEVPGTIASRQDARIAAEVSGRIVELADIGEQFEEGQILARIDDTQLRLRASELESEVSRATQRIGFLEREDRRLQRLAAQNVAAESQLDQTRSDLAVARDDRRIAAARLAQTRDQLARTEVRAPFDGLVAERFLVPGEHVSVGNVIARLINPASIEVIARAPLSAVSFVATGDELKLVSRRGGATGLVRTLVPVGDPRSHMFELRLDIPADQWRVGETVRVIVPTQARQALLAVPRDALVLRRDGTTVYRIADDNTAERISVTTGVSSDGLVAVSGDLKAGDKVIVRGAERLRPGQNVMIIGELPVAAQPGADTTS